MEKLCGKCSQAQGLTLEQRIVLAKSRIPNILYTCSACQQEHGYMGDVVKIKTGTLVETTMEQETQVEKEPERRTRNKGDQLSLF